VNYTNKGSRPSSGNSGVPYPIRTSGSSCGTWRQERGLASMGRVLHLVILKSNPPIEMCTPTPLTLSSSVNGCTGAGTVQSYGDPMRANKGQPGRRCPDPALSPVPTTRAAGDGCLPTPESQWIRRLPASLFALDKPKRSDVFLVQI